MDMVSNMYSMCVSVFPNVPERPGLPCTGEDREYMFYLQFLNLHLLNATWVLSERKLEVFCTNSTSRNVLWRVKGQGARFASTPRKIF